MIGIDAEATKPNNTLRVKLVVIFLLVQTQVYFL